MLRLDIEYSDGSRDSAQGGIDWLEAAIERAAVRAETLGARIVFWTIAEVYR